MKHGAVAEACKALGHPARVRIVELLAEQQECRGAEVFAELPLAQSTISQHLSVLKDAGLVRATAVGPSMVYCLEPGALDALVESLSAVSDSAAACDADGCS